MGRTGCTRTIGFMMMLLFQVMLLALPFAYCQVADTEDYPTFALCNQKVISEINQVWKTMGAPKNNLQQMKQEGGYTLSDTSFNFYDPPSRCIHMTNTDTVMDFFFVKRKGYRDAETIQLKYLVTEGEDGIIRAKSPFSDDPQLSFEWYTIYRNNGVNLAYACNAQIGTNVPLLASIFVPNNELKLSTALSVQESKLILKKVGLETKYSYGLDCFSGYWPFIQL